MKLLIDNANLEQIKKYYGCYPLDGVTTNPVILSREGRPPFETLKEIRAFIGPEAQLHVQVTAMDAQGMLLDARRILRELGENTYIKIPSIPEGFKAMQILSSEGIHVTGTAVFTAAQAFLAAKSGAGYAAPYLKRIDRIGFHGVETAKEIHDIFRKQEMKCEVLAASLLNAHQITELCGCGIGAVTAAPDILGELVKNEIIFSTVDEFAAAFHKLTGGREIADC